MINIQRFVLIDHPIEIFTGAAFALSAVSLKGTPSFWPLVLLITTLLLYLRIIYNRPAFFYRLLNLWFAIALAGTLANLSAGMHALATPLTSLTALAAMSLAESVLPLFTVYLDVKLCGHMRTPWAEIALFPALWATLWTGIARVNPIGRLLMWSPVQGFGSYEWLSPITGRSGIDWAVAACAVIFSQIIGAWLMGPNVQIIEYESPSISRHQGSRRVWVMSAIMVALTIPSFLITSAPLPPSSADTTPLKVGCVLPSSIYDKHHDSPLEDFIAASAQMTSAKILIWPESAVFFANPKERDAAFDEVRQRVPGPAVGISFEEYLPAKLGGRVGMKRNGFALLAPNNAKGSPVTLTYYKRHLVPIAESFSMVPSSDPPTIVSLDLDHPHNVPKSNWAPAPNYTRPIPLTASICLDFSSSTAFSALDSRPALILAPARTWHPAVGLSMWEQARARAEELGSMVLWCDGGEGGVSGVAGGGMVDFMQYGGGSWLRTIGVQWPFDETRTVYARWGDWYTVLVLWGLFGGGWAGELINQNNLGVHSVMGGARMVMSIVREWRRGWAARSEVQNGERQSLLD